MKLGITDNLRPRPSFENYLRWIRRIEPDAEFVKLSYHLGNEDEVNSVDGLILTGGGDVHPAFYGKPDAIARTEEVNERRDEFELKVIEKALEAELPILGVCRGMQIMNVCLGGTLVIDLPTAGFRSHSVREEVDLRHPLHPHAGTMLEALAGPGPHKVNSVHHQAVETPGKGLMVAAKSDDGVIEALEWVMKDRMPFLLLVQWHPERMSDYDNPCSGALAAQFVREVRNQSTHHDQSKAAKETEQSKHA